MDRTKNTTRNILAGFCYRVVHILMPFIARSVITRILGQEYLGLNTLFTSIFTFLNLAEFGFASALTFRMYEPAKNGDHHTLSVYTSVIRRVYKVVGLIMLCAGLLVLPFLPNFIKGDCPSDVNIYILYMIYLLNTAIPYLGAGYCTSIFTAFQRIDIPNMINSVITLALNIAQISLLVFTKAYYPYIVCLPLFSVLSNIALYYFRKKRYGDIKVTYKVDRSILKDTYSSAGALFGHSLNYVIVSAADNIVISSFLGLSALAMYGNYYTILSAVLGLIDIVLQSCMPSIGNLLLDGNGEHELDVFRALSFLSYWISGWCSICLLCLYQPFMRIWMGSSMLLPISSVILFAIYLYSYKSRAAVIVFKDAAGMWKADLLKPYVSAAMNIVLNIVMVRWIGLNGVLLSTICAFFIINLPWESKVLIDRRFRSFKKDFYVGFINYMIMNLMIGIATYILCTLLVFDNDLVVLCLRGGVCLVLPNVLWVMMNHDKAEYQHLIRKMAHIVKW